MKLICILKNLLDKSVNIETEIEFRMISMCSDIDFFKKFSKNFSGDDHYTKKYIMNIKVIKNI